MEIIEQNTDRLRELCVNHKVGQLYLFGSALTSRFNETSDIDLLKMGDCFIDEMTMETKLPMSKVSALLLGLEFKGLIVSLPGKMYRLK